MTVWILWSFLEILLVKRLEKPRDLEVWREWRSARTRDFRVSLEREEEREREEREERRRREEREGRGRGERGGGRLRRMRALCAWCDAAREYRV